MNPVRIGIIGYGNMGAGHVTKLLEGQVKDAVLTIVADTDPARREAAKKALPAEIIIVEDGSELIQSGACDAVLVATPHYDHPRYAMEAFDKGIHVLIEKPAGVYTKQVREMNVAATKTDKAFGVMYNQRTNPLYQKMREMVQDGTLGDIRRVSWIITDWYRTQAYYNSGGWRATWDGEGGGVLINQCPHQLDLIQWICGMPQTVRAFCHNGKWHDIEVEDDVTAYLEYPNGATGVFITTTGDAPGSNRFEITGEKGKLVCENEELTFHELSENLSVYNKTQTDGFKKPDTTIRKITVEGESTQHVGIMNSFVRHILTGEALLAPGEEGINGLTISNAMYLSSWLGETINLPLNEDLFLEELTKRRATSKKKTDITKATFDTEGTF